MSSISYVVVSTPRSATAWAARAFTLLGLHCGHEKAYNYHTQAWSSAEEGIWGDSSWMAAPFIHSLPAGTLVLHQVRDPLETISSMVGLHYFDRWGGSTPMNEYHAFVQKHMPGRMPAAALSDNILVARAAHFWAAWHRMIETNTLNRADLIYVRYRVETARETLPMLYSKITRCCDSNVSEMAAALGEPTNVNASEKEKLVVTMNMLPAHVQELAGRYGY